MPFPKNNLPSASLPWGREVEDQIEILKDAVSKNDINSFADTTTNQTNIKNINAILADQLELRTYSVELDFAEGTTKTFIGSPGLPTPVYINTSKLVHNIYLNKPRNLLINYASYYSMSTTFAANTDKYNWGIGSEVYVDDIMVDYQTTSKEYPSSVASGYTSELGNINMVKMVPVSAGYHTVSVKVSFFTSSNGATTQIGTSGDNLVVTVVQ